MIDGPPQMRPEMVDSIQTREEPPYEGIQFTNGSILFVSPSVDAWLAEKAKRIHALRRMAGWCKYFGLALVGCGVLALARHFLDSPSTDVKTHVLGVAIGAAMAFTGRNWQRGLAASAASIADAGKRLSADRSPRTNVAME